MTELEYRSLGRSGLRVSAVGLGGNTFGNGADEAQTARIIHRAFELGINFIDTADVYSRGESEEIVGKALANGRRDRVVLATKVHGTPDDIPLSPRALVRGSRAAGLEPELHALTYGWRRLPAPAQRAVHRLDALGSRRRAASFGHTLMLIARRRAQAPGSAGCAATR